MSLLPEATAEVPPTALADSARHAAGVLAARRSAEGSWLFAEAAPDPDFVLLQLWLHPPAPDGKWNPPSRPAIEEMARGLLQRQLPDGGFNAYGEGPADLDLTVRAYIALKLAGVSTDDPRMVRAREAAVRLGGLDAADGLVKLTLSFFGLYPREQCPALPPEFLLLPGDRITGLPASLRSTVVCLALLEGLGVRRSVPAGFRVDELRTGTGREWQYSGFFLNGVLLHRVASALGLRSVRAKATKRAAGWLEERKPTGALAAIAADALGYQAEYRAPSHALRDTAAAAFALGEFGYPPDLRKTGDWILSHELSPAGWSVGSDSFPSTWDTAMALSALGQTKATNDAAWQACRSRGVKWLLEKQSKNGGWSHFEADNGADPRYGDITGAVLEALGRNGFSHDDPALNRTIGYLFEAQEQDGSWAGQPGIGYIGGTCMVLRGLQAAGVSDREAAVLRAGEWLRSIQNADGGWGESAASMTERSYVPANSDSWRTASAILGLLAGGDESSLSVNKGIEYLADSQRSDGTWEETPGAGAGISEASYLSYNPYRNTYPLLALASFLRTRREVPQR